MVNSNQIVKGPNDIEVPAERNPVFCVYDEKASAYSTRTISISVSIGTAIRDFTLACQNPETFYNRFPSDYSLYHLGFFDEKAGRFASFAEPRFVIRASEILANLTPREVSNA